MTIKVHYMLKPEIRYVLRRISINENGSLIEEIAVFGDLLTANDTARALVERERRKPKDRDTATEPYEDLQNQ